MHRRRMLFQLLLRSALSATQIANSLKYLFLFDVPTEKNETSETIEEVRSMANALLAQSIAHNTKNNSITISDWLT